MKVFDQDQTLILLETRAGLVREGEVFEYYENGEVRRQAAYRDDELNGAVAVFDREGRLAYRRFFRDGKLNGSTVRYYEDGRPRLWITYKDGELEGPVCHYAPGGILQQVAVFHRGKMVSLKTFQVQGSDGEEQDVR